MTRPHEAPGRLVVLGASLVSPPGATQGRVCWFGTGVIHGPVRSPVTDAIQELPLRTPGPPGEGEGEGEGVHGGLTVPATPNRRMASRHPGAVNGPGVPEVLGAGDRDHADARP